MNPRDFLDVADELIAGPSEAYWRSSVSRAYYAAFHVADQLLTQCGFVVPHSERQRIYLETLDSVVIHGMTEHGVDTTPLRLWVERQRAALAPAAHGA